MLDQTKKRATQVARFSSSAVISRCVVPAEGFEPPTSWSEARRSDPLSYTGVVRVEGFEPPAFGTGNQRSIQLSYTR
jgi:hypothetical protein